MASLIDLIVEITDAGGWRAWRRGRRVRAAGEHFDDSELERLTEIKAYQIWESMGRPVGQHAAHWRLASEMVRSSQGGLDRNTTLAQDIERLQFQSDLSEVQLLLDYISGRPDKAFGQPADRAHPNNPGDMPPRPTIGPIADERISRDELLRVAKIRFPPARGVEANADDAALLLTLRDRLNRYVYPASGLTIAFTLLTWAPLRLFSSGLEQDWARWRLANQAYPRLGRSLASFRWSSWLVVVLAVLITFTTVWASEQGAVGQAKANRIQALARQQATMMDTIAQVEAAARGAGPPAEADSRSPVVRYCQRPKLPAAGAPPTFETIQQYETCDKFRKLQIEADTAITDIRGWWMDWKRSPAITIGCWLYRRLGGSPPSCDSGRQDQPVVVARNVGPNGWLVLVNDQAADGSVILTAPEYEQAIDTLGDLTNIWLPVAYGFIGSIVAALRSVYAKISTSTLAPWDTRLMWTRVMLGIIAGACIGLFFSPSGTGLQGSSGLGSLSLSAVAFLAGYAVDGLFAMLDEIIRRLFRLEAETSRPPQ